jgi:hypothetical protein
MTWSAGSAASHPRNARRSRLATAGLGVICALGLASVAMAQPAPAPRTAPPSIVGCYALTIQQWPKNIVFKTPPRRIELKANPIPGAAGKAAGFQVAPTSDGTSTYPRYASWVPEASGALITWTNGFSGLRMRLTTTRTGIQGIAEAFWNLQLEGSDDPKQRTGALTAQRVACS